MENSATYNGDGGEVYRLVWVPSATGGGAWVLTEIKVERPPRSWRRRGSTQKPHRPVTRKR
jgi:hypothetical protein